MLLKAKGIKPFQINTIMKIITNNRPRAIIYFHELTEKEKKEFDWCNEDNAGGFFRYRGNTYALSEFMTGGKDLRNWDGVAGDSYFSGTLVKICEDNDFVIAGRYTC